MAIRLNHSSSSSSSRAFPVIYYSVSHETIPARICFSSRNPEHRSGIQRSKHFQIKASDVQPLKAVSLRSGAAASSPAVELFETPATRGGLRLSETEKSESADLSIIVVGASGDLARNKIFPALFALFCNDHLPKNVTIFGYARSTMTDEEFRSLISTTLTCRTDNSKKCDEKIYQFLKRCFYHSSQYSSEKHFLELDQKLKVSGRPSNKLFYLAIPPSLFLDVVRCTELRTSSSNGWTRFIIEKPFGRDVDSSREMTRCLKRYLAEDQIFRMDHHMREELVENLLVLRFSNLIFQPLWSRHYIRNVQFIFSEDSRTEISGRYFDNHGIIRDVMQNHLLHLLALFAMETPVSLEAEDIRNEKVKILRALKPVKLENVVVGQYKGGDGEENTSYPAYTDDPGVSNHSMTPTFAAATLFIDNARWDGVPFLMIAGKALKSTRAEIRVQFRNVPGNLYNRRLGTDLDKPNNELVIQAQPDESIYLKINNKVPGLGMRLDSSVLNLLNKSRCTREIPEAYERLILDAIKGERRLFTRSDELDAAWRTFTPLLKELEAKKKAPELYANGSNGPVGVHYLAAKHGIRWGEFDHDDF